MIEYSADGAVAVYDGYKFRHDPKTGYYLCTKKTDIGRRERLHVYVWRKAHGTIPDGYHVHHIDENKANNELENLACISGSNHSSFHLSEYAAGHREDMRRNIIEKAVPAAIQSRKSGKRHDWYVQHGIETMKARKMRDLVCEECGKPYQSKGARSRFCCNACKSQWRRDAGIDNVIRVCAICGDKFTANKYSKTQTCSPPCSDKLAWNRSRAK